jgi:prepilin-type N-terminal cleavage/methylation domain-containing protein
MRTARSIRRSGAAQEARAFTLVEIMIVMAIIAIVMATGVPSMLRAMEKDDLARAVNDVIEGCKTARDRAILQGVPWVFIVKENGQLNVEAAPREVRRVAMEAGVEETGNMESGGKIPAAPYSGFPRQLGEDVMVQLIDVNFMSYMEAPEARVRFFPNGIADEFTMVMAWKGKQRTVTVDIITGQATELRPE